MFNNNSKFLSVVVEVVDIAKSSGVDIADKSQLKQKEKTNLLLESCRKYKKEQMHQNTQSGSE
jgi:hypothetical protein